MNISLTDTNGTYSIYLSEDFETLDDIISLLVKPVLLAAGFCEAQLDKYFIIGDDFVSFDNWSDEEEITANAVPEQPMEKVVCKKAAVATPKVVAKAPATVTPKEVFSKVPVEKKVVAAAPKAVAKVATARMAG